MIASMTGFARSTTETDWGTATWELRTVNHRYLDISQRLPEDWRGLEPKVREMLSSRLARGKVECNLRIDTSSQPAALELDMDQLRSLNQVMERMSAPMRNMGTVDPLQLLRWPGVVKSERLDIESGWSVLGAGLETALNDLCAMRSREGERLAEMLRERSQGLAGLTGGARALMPKTQAELSARLREKLDQFKEELDESKLEQAIAGQVQKLDVAEELDRLVAHLSEIELALNADEPVGRRLDFLMQELNREANTLASKSADATLTKVAVDMKVLIEQMREQVQNVE